MNDIDLKFNDFLSTFDNLGKGEWITIYRSKESKEERVGFYCALIAEDQVKRSLSDPSWDLQIGKGYPCHWYKNENGVETSTYSRFSNEGIEPLVILRDFYDIKNSYWEVSEEFRHYFKLFEDRQNNKYIYIDDNGDDVDVVLMGDKEIKIKARFLKEFLTVKTMELSLSFDFNRFSEKTIEEINIKEYHEHKIGNDFVYSIGARKWDALGDETIKTHGFLMGKKLIKGLTDYKPSLTNRDEIKYEEFIIGTDNDGKEKHFTCDENKLANYFGKNPEAPHYLTPVFFRKEVLRKYYDAPKKYSVDDNSISCCSLWSLRLDNNHPEHIMVFLGDLGRLHQREQLYWKSFNISYSGGISRVTRKRAFEGEFADPEKGDLLFKYKYEIFQTKWYKKYGWHFFCPLSEQDSHHYKSLRIPLTNEQLEFDQQVLSLTKIFIDSLNEKELCKNICINKVNAKGIDKLEAYLVSKHINIPDVITYIRNLQELRSTGVAHLKGGKYEKIKNSFDIDKHELSIVFETILAKAIRTINTLGDMFLDENWQNS